MPFKLTLAVRETVAVHRLGALEGGGTPPRMYPWGGGAFHKGQLCSRCQGQCPLFDLLHAIEYLKRSEVDLAVRRGANGTRS